MSYKNSNLYASRVFAEHPLALWAMDEGFYYYSLLSDSEKQITSPSWSITDGVSDSVFVSPAENPIEGSLVSAIYLSSSVSSSVSLYSPEVSYADKIDAEKGSVCANAYVYIESPSEVEKVQIGIAIKQSESPDTYSISFKEYTSFKSKMWTKIEHTENLEDGKNIKMFFNIVYNPLVNPGEDSTIYFSGLSLGQWSEPFNSVDTGVVSSPLPTPIEDLIQYAGEVNAIQLDPYGLNDADLGYAIEYDRRLLAETSGIPIVYGSKNNVSILFRKTLINFDNIIDGGQVGDTYTSEINGDGPNLINAEIIDGGLHNYINAENNPRIPSLIFPSKGFLSKSGKYSNLTLEFWMRANNESATPIKIMGPVVNDDGLYVGGEFITLKVDKYVKSYFIGQWYRPMLVHIGQSVDEIFLMINGEKVISIDADILEVQTLLEQSEEYLGFYGNERVSPFDIDSFSIFPYKVTEQIAKRRFVYGQGVDGQEDIITSFGGELTYFDFPYSGYNSTISFPDRTPWSNGYYNNLRINTTGISLPEYTLPEIIFSNTDQTISEGDSSVIWRSFESDNFNIQDEIHPFISLVPNNSYSTLDSTIYFSTLNKTDYKTELVYAILETGSDVSSEQSLLYFSKSSTTDYFEVKIQSGSIQYIYNDDQIFSESVSAIESIAVGIDLGKISNLYPELETFFSNTENMFLNFAGRSGNVFLGKIFSLTLNNDFFVEKDNIIGQTGIASKTFNSNMYTYVGAYTLVAKKSNSSVFFDIASSGYWESSIPMSYFGKYVTDTSGNRVYDLDLIQFNIDIPATPYSKSNEISQEYHSGLKTKSYLTLQEKQSVGMNPYTNYENTVVIGNNRVLDFNNNINYENTKFDVCDSTVIFPPKNNVDFNDYYVGVHIIVTSNGINSENIAIKKMSFAGLSYNESVPNEIKTPTGRSINPITKSEGQYFYKEKNPILVENETSSYFYITGDHGLCVLPHNILVTDGIRFNINEALKPDVKMVGIQAYFMFNEGTEFLEQKTFAKVISESRTFNFLLIPELDGKRAFIKMVDENFQEIPGLIYFINGKETENPVVKPLQWNSILISFQDNKINLNRSRAYFEVYSGVRVNNFSSFTDINEIGINLSISNGWDDLLLNQWEGYISQTWSQVLDEYLIPVTILSIDGQETFNTYSGLSYAIGDDNSLFTVDFDNVSVLNDATWNNFDIKPI